jgi:hypothetical protein
VLRQRTLEGCCFVFVALDHLRDPLINNVALPILLFAYGSG